MSVVKMMAPDVGTLIDVDDKMAHGGSRGYRVTGWMKAAPERPPIDFEDAATLGIPDLLGAILFDTCRKLGPDNVRLMWCTREEAEYVTASGVSGGLFKVGAYRVTGVVNWPADIIEEERKQALSLVGSMLA